MATPPCGSLPSVLVLTTNGLEKERMGPVNLLPSTWPQYLDNDCHDKESTSVSGSLKVNRTNLLDL